MIGDLCTSCGTGFIMPSGRCDFCQGDLPAEAALKAKNKELVEALGSALRQWRSYYSDRNSNDIETSNHHEAILYRRCMRIAKDNQ